jgi:hypothetical protein
VQIIRHRFGRLRPQGLEADVEQVSGSGPLQALNSTIDCDTIRPMPSSE